MLDSTMALIAAAMSTGIGVFAAAILALRKDWRTDPGMALAVFLTCSALSGLDTILTVTGVYAKVPWLLGVLWLPALLYGPAIYAYVRMSRKGERVGWTGGEVWRIAWPAAVAALLVMPFFLLDPQTRAAIYLDVQGSVVPPLVSVLTSLFILLFLVVTFGYLVAALRALVHHEVGLQDLFSNIENRSLSWLRWVLLAMVAAWIWGVVKSAVTVSDDGSRWAESLSAWLELAWVLAFGFFGIRHQQLAPACLPAPAAETSAGLPQEKYQRSSLDLLRQKDIAQRLDRAMTRDYQYRDPLLSLQGLAAHIGAPPNHVSQTLNDHLGSNFFDFVNRYRVEEAVRRIGDSGTTILEIAYEVGFNSRSTFNAAVKKHTGKTPSAFRRAPGRSIPQGLPDG